jgi:hypothetical protein
MSTKEIVLNSIMQHTIKKGKITSELFSTLSCVLCFIICNIFFIIPAFEFLTCHSARYCRSVIRIEKGNSAQHFSAFLSFHFDDNFFHISNIKKQTQKNEKLAENATLNQQGKFYEGKKGIE